MEDFNPVLALLFLAVLPLAVPVCLYAMLRCLGAVSTLLLLGPDRAMHSLAPSDP
jgi:hypothetical protein